MTHRKRRKKFFESLQEQVCAVNIVGNAHATGLRSDVEANPALAGAFKI